MRPWVWRHQEPQGAWKREVAGAGGCSAAWAIQVARLAVAGAGVCRRCDAVGAVKTAQVTGARGCSAAWATKIARLAVAGAGVCRRCDAVGAVKTAEVHGARAEFCCRSRYMARGPGFAAVAAQWGR